MLLIHNPEYWIKECLSNLFLPLILLTISHILISSNFLLVSSGGRVGGGGHTFVELPSPWSPISKSLGCSETHPSEICTPPHFQKKISIFVLLER